MRRLQDRSRSHIDQLLVVEQDGGTTDQQSAVLLHLAERATKQTGTNGIFGEAFRLQSDRGYGR